MSPAARRERTNRGWCSPSGRVRVLFVVALAFAARTTVVRYSGGSIGHSDGRAHAVARRRGRPTGTARPALPGAPATKDSAKGSALFMMMMLNRGAPSPPPALHVVSAGRWFSMICRRTRATVRPSLLLFPSRLLKQHDMHAGHCYPRRLHAGLKIPECGRMVVLLLFGDCDTRNSCRKPRSGLAPPLTRCGAWIGRNPRDKQDET